MTIKVIGEYLFSPLDPVALQEIEYQRTSAPVFRQVVSITGEKMKLYRSAALPGFIPASVRGAAPEPGIVF